MEEHERDCADKGLPAEQTGWLLAEELVPGKKRRKLSTDVTRFLRQADLPSDPPPPDSQSQA